METCPICKTKINDDSNLIIMSNHIEHRFYSKKCIKKFVENPFKYLPHVKIKYDINKIDNSKKNNTRLYIDQIK